MKVHSLHMKKATAWVTIILFMSVILTSSMVNCVCAIEKPLTENLSENCTECCCAIQMNSNKNAASAVASQYIKCPCGSNAAPLSSLDDYLNASTFDITTHDLAYIHTIYDTVHLSLPGMSDHGYVHHDYFIPELSITSLKTTVLLT